MCVGSHKELTDNAFCSKLPLTGCFCKNLFNALRGLGYPTYLPTGAIECYRAIHHLTAPSYAATHLSARHHHFRARHADRLRSAICLFYIILMVLGGNARCALEKCSLAAILFRSSPSPCSRPYGLRLRAMAAVRLLWFKYCVQSTNT